MSQAEQESQIEHPRWRGWKVLSIAAQIAVIVAFLIVTFIMWLPAIVSHQTPH
jgi:hypothetical protein